MVGIGFGGHVVARWAGGTGRDEPPHAAYWTTAHSTETGAGDPVAAAVDGRRVLVLATAREEWQESQHTTERVLAALVAALTLMQERRKMPVFALNPAKGEG